MPKVSLPDGSVGRGQKLNNEAAHCAPARVARLRVWSSAHRAYHGALVWRRPPGRPADPLDSVVMPEDIPRWIGHLWHS
jgi:hypothetical protein